MCECGCGELRAMAKLRAPGGGWYAIEVYPGCRDCGTGWALGASKIAAGREEEEYLLENVEEVVFDQYGTWGRPILDTDVLLDQFAKDVGGDDDLGEANFALQEFVDHGGLQAVFFETRRKELPGSAQSPTTDNAETEEDDVDD
jgi:hypothetical protein